MGVPEPVRETRRRYLDDEQFADLGTCAIVDNSGALYGNLTKPFVRTFGLTGEDRLQTYADFQNGVLMQTPAELVEEVSDR